MIRILSALLLTAVTAVVFAQVDMHGRLLVQGELVLEHVSLGQLVDSVQARTVELYGRRGPCFDAGDLTPLPPFTTKSF